MTSKHLTFTASGIDSFTDINRAISLSQEFKIEYAVLLSSNPKSIRYPTLKWIEKKWSRLPHKAIHICGHSTKKDFIDNKYDYLIYPDTRIQLNGNWTKEQVELICSKFSNNTIITQHNHYNLELLNVSSHNHSILVDSSGGKGKLPTFWERPSTPKTVGFAGGLGPDTIKHHLPLIASSASEYSFWIDMEQRLRNNKDMFSLDLVEQTFSQATKILSSI